MAPWHSTTLRLALNGAMANGEALIGSFGFGAKIDSKRGLRFDASNSVRDSFLKNQSVLGVELRCFLAITRPRTSAKITGLPPTTP